MSLKYKDKIAFTTDRGLYCYKVMPFGLKNVGATYQRLVNNVFLNLIGRTMEVYVDDMLAKSLKKGDHVSNLCEMFALLRKYHMKLNSAKCAFGVGSEKFLGFMVNHRGIQANPSKVQALLDLRSLKTIKDIQKLTGMIAALSRFVSKSTDKCRPFFQALKMRNNLVWSAECEEAFIQIKQYLGGILVLAKPTMGEDLMLYLSVFEHSVSGVLVRDEAMA